MKQILSIKYKISSSFIILWIGCIFGSFAVLPYLLFFSATHLSLIRILGYFLQNTILYALVCAGGLYISPKVGFNLILGRKDKLEKIKKCVFPAFFYGLFIGFIILVFTLIVFKSPSKVANPPWYLGLLASFYGAINEEVMARLFLLSTVMWGLQKILKSKSERLYWIGIIVVALLFGLGHLPAAFQIMPVTVFSIFGILFFNGIAGVTFGYLYWCYNVETAMFAHFIADLVLHVFPQLVLK